MRLFKLYLWIVFLFLITACNSYGFNSNQEQPDTGQITVYTTLEQEQIDAYIALFNTEYPNIQVNVFRESTGIVNEKFFAEGHNPQADLIFGVPITMAMLAEWKFMLHGYAPVGLERIEPRFRDHAHPPHWVGMSGWKSVFCVNHEKITQLKIPVPQSATDLIDPIYSGQIIIPNPKTSGTALFLMSTVFEYQDEIAGWGYLDLLNQNVAQYADSAAKTCEAVAEGKYAIGISHDVIAAKLKSQGSPIDIIFPAEGIGWGMNVNALIKKKYIKPTAKTFLDWAISDSAMNKYAEEFAITAVQTKQALPLGYPAGPKPTLIDPSFPWITANRERILEKWQIRYIDKSTP